MKSAEKTAIVTGAGSGIGRETAILLGEAGYAVALVGRTESNLRDTAAGIAAPTLLVAADLCDPHAPQRIIDETLAAWGRIDALAHVAGDAPLQPIDAVTPEIWRRCIDTNLSAAVLLTAAAWPTFRRQKGGVIINVSSMSSIDPFPGFSIYAAAKIGLNMFTRTAATEGAPIGVRAVALAPGAVETPLLRRLFDHAAIPPDQAMPPRAVAEVIRDCITGKRHFESGETIPLTGM